MRKPLLYPLLVFEFLLAVQVVFTFWSQVGGQYHLDLMFWPWKFGVSVMAAGLTTALTAELARADGARRGRMILWFSVLTATVLVAGVVTYYYHLNEPPDDSQDDDEPAKVTRLVAPAGGFGWGGWRDLQEPGRSV